MRLFHLLRPPAVSTGRMESNQQTAAAGKAGVPAAAATSAARTAATAAAEKAVAPTWDFLRHLTPRRASQATPSRGGRSTERERVASDVVELAAVPAVSPLPPRPEA